MTNRPAPSFRPSNADLDRLMRQFGVTEAQVRRDFAISWLLWSISRSTTDVVFFGGTALSRTLLPTLRLSEDIDLMPIGPRSAVAHAVHEGFSRDLERGFGAVAAVPPLPSTRHPNASVYTIGGHQVGIQLVDSYAYPWPWHHVELDQRFDGCPPVGMNVLTSEGFAAAKTAAWCERNTPRDLYDLWALATGGRLTPAAAAVFRKLGPTNSAPGPAIFPARPPTEQAWQDALRHQCVPAVGPTEAFSVVVQAWATASRTDQA